MKKLPSIMIGCLLSSMTYAADINSLTEEFQQVEVECDFMAQDANTVKQARDSFDKQACLDWNLKTTLMEHADATQEVLVAALSAQKTQTSNIIRVAINSGVNPAQVVENATRIYPKMSDDISKVAIMAGADPAVVTEATAAGIKK